MHALACRAVQPGACAWFHDSSGAAACAGLYLAEHGSRCIWGSQNHRHWMLHAMLWHPPLTPAPGAAQNLVLAIGSIAALALPAVLGFIPLGVAVALHEGATVLVVLNSLRLLRAARQGPHLGSGVGLRAERAAREAAAPAASAPVPAAPAAAAAEADTAGASGSQAAVPASVAAAGRPAGAAADGSAGGLSPGWAPAPTAA